VPAKGPETAVSDPPTEEACPYSRMRWHLTLRQALYLRQGDYSHLGLARWMTPMFRCLLSQLVGQGLAPPPLSSAQCGLSVLGRTPLPRRLVPLRLDLTSSRGKRKQT
jgi:hypothetical protein